MSDQIDRNTRIDVTVGMLRDLVKDIGVFVKEKLDPIERRIGELEARARRVGRR